MDAEALRAALEAVFGQPAFRRELEQADDNALSPWQVLWQKLLELLRRFLVSLEELHGSAPILYWLVFSGLVLLLVLLLAHIAWTFRRAFQVELPEGDEPAVSGERAQRFAELRERARVLAGQGDWREAARLYLLALLALIEELEVLHLARGWTNREILQRLALPGAEGAALEVFRRHVEDAWYGGHTLDRAQLAELGTCVDRCARVLQAGGRRGGGR